jgi:hypothetical protein
MVGERARLRASFGYRRPGASCDQPSGRVTIEAAYVVANAPIIREQLQKAGVRLAHLLDSALGK